jgi:hypothetical protein
MAVLSPMSDLEAVNRMLASIGQAPVNTLEVTGIGDVAKAYQQLLETSRDVQLVGYSWTTDERFELTPDADGAIILPNGALDVDASANSTNVVVRRHPEKADLALYNQDENTFVFSEPLEARIIWGFPFNDLPPAARSYIAVAAARRFQAQIVSSPVLDRFNEEDENRAFMMLQRHERRTRDTNVFRRSPELQRWTGSRRF